MDDLDEVTRTTQIYYVSKHPKHTNIALSYCEMFQNAYNES